MCLKSGGKTGGRLNRAFCSIHEGKAIDTKLVYHWGHYVDRKWSQMNCVDRRSGEIDGRPKTVGDQCDLDGCKLSQAKFHPC
jgi:hypothetical protein